MSPRTDYKMLLEDAASALQGGRLALLVGAGISMHRQSNLPAWAEMVYAILDALREGTTQPSKTVLEKQEGHLLNEALLQVLDGELGRDETVRALRACLDSDAYSPIHSFLSRAAEDFDATILTTNYDELIERASGGRVKPLKLHGSLDQPNEMRFTFTSVFSGLRADLATAVHQAVQGRLLIVAGYRGADEFDVMPAVFGTSKRPAGVIWTYVNDEPDTLVQGHYRGIPNFVERLSIDQFAADIWARAKGISVPVAGELGSLFPAAAVANVPNWWRPRIASWGKDIRRRHPSAAKLVWPRVMEHVAPATPLAASELVPIYAEFVNSSPDGLSRIIAKARLLRWKRIQKSFDEHEFFAAEEELRTRIEATQHEEEKDHLAPFSAA